MLVNPFKKLTNDGFQTVLPKEKRKPKTLAKHLHRVQEKKKDSPSWKEESCRSLETLDEQCEEIIAQVRQKFRMESTKRYREIMNILKNKEDL